MTNEIHIGDLYHGRTEDGVIIHAIPIGIRDRMAVPNQTHVNVQDGEKIHFRWRSEEPAGGKKHERVEKFLNKYTYGAHPEFKNE